MSDAGTVVIESSKVPVNECHQGHDSILFNGADCPCCKVIAGLKRWRGQERSLAQKGNKEQP